MKSYAFLFWAYNVVWILIAAYLGVLLARLRGLGTRLSRLEARLAQKSSDS
jgi:hypothetical protein